MLFNSIKYIIFLPLVVLIYYIIPFNKKNNLYRNIFLLIASYYFYMCWMPKYALLMLFSTLITYITGILLDKLNNKNIKKLILIISLIINICILFIFKYYNFFIENIIGLFNLININFNVPINNLLLPVGISFYTFQAIGYSIDVYRNDIRCEKNFINYALFVSFFPQLVAGPIERAANLLPQFKQKHDFLYSNAVKGLRLILIGFFKKIVIADTISVFTRAVFTEPSLYTGLTLIVAIFLFSIQIYCDFSGYSDIAIGSARILGFKLMENFRTPYFSESIGEFWNRWHISLNNWFKDYVYIPLGGNKKGFFIKCINLLIVFLLSGIWHGASWNFIIWGTINGIYRIFQELYKKISKPITFKYKFLYKVKKILKVIFTYLLICFTWIFFATSSLTDAIYIIKNLNNLSLYTFINNCYIIISQNILNLSIVRYFYIIMIVISVLILVVIDITIYKREYLKMELIDCLFRSNKKIIRWTYYCILSIFIIWMFIMQNGILGQTGEFIYFQF